MARAPSLQTVAVLQAIASGYRHGFDICDAAELSSGTVYPILGRLEDDGLLTSHWEDARIAQREGRPPRRYYALTLLGQAELRQALARLRALSRGSFAAARRPKLSRG